MKELIGRMSKKMEKKVEAEDKARFLDSLKALREVAPESKRKEVDDMIKLVENLKVAKPGEPVPPP